MLATLPLSLMSNSIPSFDHNLVLPPHRGNPTQPADLSPYPCTSLEFCRRFNSSLERRDILLGFLTFRTQLRELGLVNGFQWLDGCFLEDIETKENRAPHDLDLVTFYWGYDQVFQKQLLEQLPAFANPPIAKQLYRLDHYPVDISHNPQVTVEWTRYWTHLFSHTRQGAWKGMLRIDLNTSVEDSVALSELQHSSL